MTAPSKPFSILFGLIGLMLFLFSFVGTGSKSLLWAGIGLFVLAIIGLFVEPHAW